MTAREPTWAELFAEAKRADMLAVAQRLGAKLTRSGAHWTGPCPAGCAKRDGFIVSPAKRLFYCRPSGARGDAVDMVEHALGIDRAGALAFVLQRDLPGSPYRGDSPPHVAVAPAALPPDDAAATTTRQALALWREAVDPRETLVERYLASRRLGLGGDLAGDVLRWHPGVRAMLALFRNIDTGHPQAVSRAFLDPEGRLRVRIDPETGRKTKRWFLGPVKGAAVMLDRFDAVTNVLHVGEGIETCMTARQLGLMPAWALGSKDAVAAFQVIRGVERLELLQENDGGPSERACAACGARWHAAGRKVSLIEPKRGKDLNDAIRLRSAS